MKRMFYSFDEHGSIDIPETMDYIFNTTSVDKVHFVGYSMGTTVYMIMCHERPDLAKKIASFVGMAPAIYMSNLKPLAKAIEKLGILVSTENRTQ